MLNGLMKGIILKKIDCVYRKHKGINHVDLMTTGYTN